MKRRDVIIAFGGGGATGLASSHVLPSVFGDEDVQRRVALASQDSVADDHEIRIDVEILQPTITATHTARLQITTTNKGPKRAISIGTDGCALFSRSDGGSDEPPGLWLHSYESAENITRDGNRWVRDNPTEQPRRFLAYGCHPKEYDAGESLTNEYVVWDDFLVDGYLEPGTYRWEENVSIQDEESDSGEPATITWGFSLTVENPD